MSVEPSALEIVRYPHPALRYRTRPIREINESVRAVAGRMIELMHEAEGVGLAAPQVGLDWRMFVANSGEEGEADLVYINPVISALSRDLAPREEGCLSLPGITAEIRRPVQVTITALDAEGHEFTLTRDDLLARVWQHEFDHLNGVLIIDKMTPMDRIANRRAVKSLEAAGY